MRLGFVYPVALLSGRQVVHNEVPLYELFDEPLRLPGSIPQVVGILDSLLQLPPPL